MARYLDGKSETLTQLLTGFDCAMGLAQTEDIFTDEVNAAKTPAKLSVHLNSSGHNHSIKSRRPEFHAYERPWPVLYIRVQERTHDVQRKSLTAPPKSRWSVFQPMPVLMPTKLRI